MSDNSAHGAADYEHVWPPYNVDAPSPTLRTFDLRTCDERMQTWLAALEQRQEADRQRIAHLERCMQKLLNPSEEPDGEEVAA